MDYNFTEIEKKWQRYWEEKQVFLVTHNSSKPKYYVLDMFPYPSGSGLHVGHPLGYIASDIFSRYKRLQGFNVLHPMGFDAFGLPAEQYAIETGQHPAVTTQQNIKRYKEQLCNIGFCYDWSREIHTCDPSYYKWTQWIFLQLFKSWYNKASDRAEPIETLIKKFSSEGTEGVEAATAYTGKFTSAQWNDRAEKEQEEIIQHFRLAYLAWAEVNWCTALGTVLANDEVKDGHSERGGHPVFRKKMRQWFLRITAYSDRLLYGLDEIDWPAPLKEMQRNWIGRSEGASVLFQVADSNEKIEIFTTRPDTIFGATFMVLAPEHERVGKLTTKRQKEAISSYLDYVKSRSDVERQQEKKVTGEFTGSYVIHPFTKQRIPVWIAEYVLAGYGTGAIMAVPSDDERDFLFAQMFGLPVIDVIDRTNYPDATREDKVGKLINSGFINGMEVKDAIRAILEKIEESGIGRRRVNYRMRDAGFSRQRYWGEPFPIVYKKHLSHALSKGEDLEEVAPYPLREDQLPVNLPEVDSYLPSGDGDSPLSGNKNWVNLPDGSMRETNTMPGYAGSSWYYLRYMDPHNENTFLSSEAENYWQNVDLYMGGAEHAVGHLLYARLWHKVLCDLGYISTQEPFKKLINQGMIQGRSNIVYRIAGTNKFVSQGLKANYETTALRVDVNIVDDDVLNIEAFRQSKEEFQDAEFILEEGNYYCGYEIEKMSKRWHNVVNPDDMVAKYGADCFRMYEMFLGPIEQHKPWDTKGIEGVSRFLKKFWKLFRNEKGEFAVSDAEPVNVEMKVLHKTIKKIKDDTERFSFNTGVSTFMICVNELTELKCNKRAVLEQLTILISPYAPHIAEELWFLLGKEGSVANAAFPIFDQHYLTDDSFTYPVSFNGKMRFRIELPANLSPDQIEKEVMTSEMALKWLEGKAPKKVIVVPKRIVNVVV